MLLLIQITMRINLYHFNHLHFDDFFTFFRNRITCFILTFCSGEAQYKQPHFYSSSWVTYTASILIFQGQKTGREYTNHYRQPIKIKESNSYGNSTCQMPVEILIKVNIFLRSLMFVLFI